MFFKTAYHILMKFGIDTKHSLEEHIVYLLRFLLLVANKKVM